MSHKGYANLVTSMAMENLLPRLRSFADASGDPFVALLIGEAVDTIAADKKDLLLAVELKAPTCGRNFRHKTDCGALTIAQKALTPETRRG
jgi:hypothetical protein